MTVTGGPEAQEVENPHIDEIAHEPDNAELERISQKL